MSVPAWEGEARGSGVLELGLAGGEELRWVAADLTPVVETARRRLDCSPIAATALGRCLTAAALLLRLTSKVPSRLLVEVRGDGPLGAVIAEADDRGHLRGMATHPRVDLPHEADGRLRIGPAVGRGNLRVTRSFRAHAHTSQVALVTGEIGTDLAHYLEASEQIRSAVLVGVLAGPDGISAAGGVIVQALPGCSDDSLERLEANLAVLEGVSRPLEAGGLSGLLDTLLAGLDRRPLETGLLRYHCRCRRRSVARVLGALRPADLAELREPDGSFQAECSFCGRTYRFEEG